MKISLWIPAVVLYMVRAASSNSVQVGTVLFTTTDLVKKCWTESDKSLLKARLIMQDVLPDPNCIDFNNPESVAVFLDYFHSCFQIISTCTYGKIQNLMYLALSDAFGGYLRAYVLPFTRKAYYAGEVKYLEAKKLFQLYDDIRVFLKTTGIGWVEPQKFCRKDLHVRPLVITGGVLEACQELFLIEKKGKLHSLNAQVKTTNVKTAEEITQVEKTLGEPPDHSSTSKFIPKHRNRRKATSSNTERHKPEDFHFCNATTCFNSTEPLLRNLAKGISEIEADICKNQTETCETENPSDSLKRVIVPLPVLDDCEHPHSIAVPFKKHPFRNLKAQDSAFILEYYYLTVIKCFVAKGNTRVDINNFNSHFRSWLLTQVIPHLEEEDWYPGFGGVLRVLQTIKNFGVDVNMKDPALNDIAFMFSDGVEFEIRDSLKEKGKDKVRDVTMNKIEDENETGSKRHIVTAIIIVSLFWLFIFCAFVFYCQARRSGREPSECRSRSRPPSRTRFKPPEKQDKIKRKRDENVNFQFLVSFFKRQEEEKKERKELSYNMAVGRDVADSQRKKKPPREEKEKECYFGSLVSSVLPVQQILTSYEKPLRMEDMSRGDGRHRGHDDKIEMLWKKPSVSFIKSPVPRGRAVKSRKVRYESTVSGTGSEPRGGTCSYSCSGCGRDSPECSCLTKPTSTWCSRESCDYDRHRTTTSTTSRDNVSSATMEFFEEVIARHKAKKSSTQCSTEETESECSSSTLTDY